MKNQPLLLTLGACFLACALPTAALAKGKGAAAAPADPNAAPGAAPGGGKKALIKEEKNLFVKYDKNSNGLLDPEEKEAIRADFAADPSSLKMLDKNNDGMLDDSEISVLKAKMAKKKKK